MRNIDPDGMWTETAEGYASDNASEAQAFVKEMQQREEQRPSKDKANAKQHPEIRKTATRDRTAPNTPKPNARQIAIHTAVILSAAEANMGWGVAPYKAGSTVSEFRAFNARGFVRTFTTNKTKMEGTWIMRAKDIEGLTPEQIQAKFAMPNAPDAVADVDIPDGVIMRTGIAASAFGQVGGGRQFQLMGRATFNNARILPPNMPPMANPVAPTTETIEPIEPIESIEPPLEIPPQ